MKALDIDEKLTLRLLKLSSSQRTVLINRGVEDGLAVNDHAKFYLPTGMVARGVVVKTSPARSIWSLYRIIAPSALVENKVLNLKIATPVKITPDPSKMIIVEPVAIPGKDIPVSPDGQALAQSGQGDEDLKQMEEEEIEEENKEEAEESVGSVAGNLREKTTSGFELTGTLGLGGLATSIETPGGVNDTKSDAVTSYDFALGVEKYFLNSSSWDKNLSLEAEFFFGQNVGIDAFGNSTTNRFYGPSVGGAYHFLYAPNEIKKPIAYVDLVFGFGFSKDRSSDESGETLDFSGDIISFRVGGGFKYYWGSWGGKVNLSYYERVEHYQVEYKSQDEAIKEERVKTFRGPKISLSLLYRF